MELRHLRYFIAVAEELHFTRAAERLHIAQPPLSRQIRDLEEELGVTLLLRTPRRIELTDAGRSFLERARQILSSTEAAVVEAQRAQRGEEGALAVGFFEHVAYTLLPSILHTYRERFPRVDVQLRWYPVIDQLDALLRGDVDISFVRPVADFGEVQRQVLVREVFMLAVPATHRFAAMDEVPIRECADEPLITYTQRSAPDFHQEVTRLCAAAGFVPRIGAELAQVFTALAVVSSGAGIAFVPASVRKLGMEGVVYKPVRARQEAGEVSLISTRRNPSPILESFVEVAVEVTSAPAGDFP